MARFFDGTDDVIAFLQKELDFTIRAMERDRQIIADGLAGKRGNLGKRDIEKDIAFNNGKRHGMSEAIKALQDIDPEAMASLRERGVIK